MLLRWIGGLLILLFAIVLGREYSGFAEAKISALSEYVKVLFQIEKMIETCLATPAEIFGDFCSPPLEKCGFLSAVREGRSLGSAFSSAEKCGLPSDAITLLSDYFDGFGKGYAEREIARARKARGELETILAREREGTQKSVRVTSAMLLGGAAGVLIFII